MANITLHLDPETEHKLREKASLLGQTLETYLEQLADQDTSGKNGVLPSQLTDEEFDKLLDELSAGQTLPHLPADLSRADLHGDHD